MKNKFLHLLITLLLCPQLAFSRALDAGFYVGSETFDEGNLSPEELELITSVSNVQITDASVEEEDVTPLSLSGQPVTGQHFKGEEECGSHEIIPAVKHAMPFKLESSCLNNRPRAAEYSFETEAFGDPTQYITSDTKTCECMKGSGTGKLEEKAETKPDADALFLQNLLANAKTKQQRVQSASEGIVVQSMLISGDKTASMRLMSMVGNKQDSTTLAAISRAKAIFIHDALKKLNNKTPEKEEKIKQIAEQLYPPKGIEKMELPAATPPAGSCITMQSYLSYEQAPKEPEFYADVANMKDYDSKQWDLNNLKAEYDKAYIEAEQASSQTKGTAIKKLKAVKARINFLNKNPLVANFLAINPDKVGHPQKKGRIKRFQKALYRLIKNNLRPNTTVGSIAAFRAGLARFFSNDIVGMLVRNQLDDQMLEEYGNVEDLISQKIPSTQPAIENRLRLISGGSVKDCSSATENMNLEKCSKDFHAYCKILAISDTAIKQKSFALNSPSENLDEQTQFDFNTNPEKNEGFKRVSELLCHKKRIAVNGKKGDRPVDFAEFKAQYCTGNGASAECQQANNETLLQKFITEYKFADESLNNKATAQVASVYSAIASVQPKVELTKDDISEVSSNVVTFSDLAKEGYSKNALFTGGNKGEVSPMGGDSVSKSDDKGGSNNLPMTYDALTPQPGILNPMAPMSSTPQIPYANASATQMQKELEEVDEERTELKEKIAKSTEEITKVRKSEDKSELEEMEKRLKALEKLLAKKDEDYKKLIEDQGKEKENATGLSGSPKKSLGGMPDESGPGSSVRSSIRSHGREDAGSSTVGSRSPASTLDIPASMLGPQAASAKAMDRSGSGVTGGTKVSGSTGLLNSALLEKYGIVVSGPTDSSVLVAPEKDPKNLGLVASAQDGKNVPVTVSSIQYEKVKINDLDSLKELYEKQLKDISGSVLKISVTSSQKGSSPIEFYAIREGGKVVFQPVRTHELKDLRIIFKK